MDRTGRPGDARSVRFCVLDSFTAPSHDTSQRALTSPPSSAHFQFHTSQSYQLTTDVSLYTVHICVCVQYLAICVCRDTPRRAGPTPRDAASRPRRMPMAMHILIAMGRYAARGRNLPPRPRPDTAHYSVSAFSRFGFGFRAPARPRARPPGYRARCVWAVGRAPCGACGGNAGITRKRAALPSARPRAWPAPFAGRRDGTAQEQEHRDHRSP